jgi:hypothetical protein
MLATWFGRRGGVSYGGEVGEYTVIDRQRVDEEAHREAIVVALMRDHGVAIIHFHATWLGGQPETQPQEALEVPGCETLAPLKSAEPRETLPIRASASSLSVAPSASRPRDDRDWAALAWFGVRSNHSADTRSAVSVAFPSSAPAGKEKRFTRREGLALEPLAAQRCRAETAG